MKTIPRAKTGRRAPTTPAAGAPGASEARRRRALLKTGALQRAILSSANFSSIATDEKGVIQVFNVGAERMLGYAAAAVIDRITPADFSDPQEVILRARALSQEFGTPIEPGFEALVFKASRGIEDIYELTYLRQDGSRLPAVVSVTALHDAAGAIIGYLLIGTDNTARKQVDLALQERNRDLRSAKIVAELANQAKSDFLSSMSHELRSPLNAILGFAQLMDSGSPPPTPAQKDSIDQILQAGWYLLELINEILDLALIESGKLSLSPEPVLLSELLAECLAMIEPLSRKAGIAVTLIPPDGPCLAKADRTRLKQVVVNLLSNAVKYNRPDGTVEVRCRVMPDRRLRVSFQDTGEGLAADKLARLFQPFDRLGRELGPEEGTGIGLVVSKRLVELMGGTIGADSVVGVGSRFWIDLNATQGAEGDLDTMALFAAPQRGLGAEAPARALRTVLCVEDNPANLLLVGRLLERRPELHLINARDGRRGIELAREAMPDVILMDINLPGISGITTLKILAGDPLTRHIPVIALSANAMPKDIATGLAAGFFRYLTKPIRVDEFMATLDLALDPAGAAARQAQDEATPSC